MFSQNKKASQRAKTDIFYLITGKLFNIGVDVLVDIISTQKGDEAFHCQQDYLPLQVARGLEDIQKFCHDILFEPRGLKMVQYLDKQLDAFLPDCTCPVPNEVDRELNHFLIHKLFGRMGDKVE
jgi:hypothetical protein